MIKVNLRVFVKIDLFVGYRKIYIPLIRIVQYKVKAQLKLIVIVISLKKEIIMLSQSIKAI